MFHKEYDEDDSKPSSDFALGHHHWHNELLSSLLAGTLSAYLTNGLEIIAVNK